MDVRITVETSSETGEKRMEELLHLSLRNDRERANDVIRTIRGLGVEPALQAARDVFPRLRPSEVNDTDRLAEIIEALEAVLADFSDVSGRTIEVAGSDSSGRPDTNRGNKTKTCTATKRGNDQPLRTTPAQAALLATQDLRETMELYWSAQDQRGKLSWSSVMSAARDRARQLGVSGAFWQRQCDLLGGQRTALCLVRSGG